MATADGDDSRTQQIEEEMEGDRIETSDYFFSKIGEAVPLAAEVAPFDANTLPANPLVVSERFHLVFVAHTSGFCVAKTQDVIASAKEIKDKGEGPSVRGSSFIDVSIGTVNILALSLDSSYLAAVVGKQIHCFSVDSLLAKDQEPIFSTSVESDYIKDVLWVKLVEASFIVLTNIGKLYAGGLYKPLKYLKDEIDAVERNVDGHLLAVVRRDILSIFSSNFEEILKFALPLNSLFGDSTTSRSVKVDSIRWVRSDSIVVGCLPRTEDGMEEGYFVQVIMSKDGKIIDGSSKLSAVCFNDIFPGIIDDIVPFGCGPHLLMKYLEKCGLGFVSNRKNTDQHIMLFTWSAENNQVSLVDIERDSWLPRIELQENGDENLVLGLCIDKISVYENVKIKIGVEEQKELPPLCILLCLTLEGKLIMFNVASIAGPQDTIQALSAASNGEESVPAVGILDSGGSLLSEEERTKQSALYTGPYDLDAKKVGIEPDEILVRKDPKPFGMSNYLSFAPNSDVDFRKESNPVSNMEKALVDIEAWKSLEDSGHSSQGTLNQFLGKNSLMVGTTIVSGTAKNENWNIEADQPLGKTAYTTNKSVAEKTGSGVSQSTPGPAISSSFLAISDVSNTNSSASTPSITKSNLFKSIHSATSTADNTANFLGNHGHQSDSLNSSLRKGTNHSQKAVLSSGATEGKFGISCFKMQSQGLALQNSIDQSHSMKVNHKISSFPAKLNTDQGSSKQFSNVQHMADELDELMECIEEAGGFTDVCTTAHRGSLEMIEEGMRILSERSRGWQSNTEKQLHDIQLLLDKTLQVLARKTHIEAIIRQTTDKQYWELWDRQKLSSELELKRQNLLNLSQDLINQMIGLENHFNALEFNLFGESGGMNTVSQAVQYKRTPPRYSQSLYSVHKALVSQLAAAEQLSEFLARQMDVLSIRSPPEKEKSVKKQLFESIGIPCPGDHLGSPDIGKVIDFSSNKKSLVSRLDSALNGSRRNQLSGLNCHDPQTARRRRDSLDRNWANFEAPKTTVKRMLVENQHDIRLSSLEKIVTPCKLEGSAATYPKVLSVQDRNGSMDIPNKLSSEAMAPSVFKSAGANPEMSITEADRSSRLQNIQGSSFSTMGNTSASSSQLSSPPSSFMDLTIKLNNLSSIERSGARVEHVDKSEPVLTKDLKPSSSQFGHDKSTFPRMQPQLLSSPVKSSEMPIPSSKGTLPTMSVSGRSSLFVSTHNTLESPPVSITSGSTSLSSTPSVPILPSMPIGDGLETSLKVVNGGKNQVLPSVSSSFPFSPVPPQINSFSSKGPSTIFMGSTINSAGEPSANKVGEKLSPAFIPQPQNLLSLASNGLKFKGSMQSGPLNEAPKEIAFGSSHDSNTTVILASDTVSNTQSEKASTTIGLPSVSLSDSVGTNGEKNTVDAVVAQEDEMEEEAPETNQTADLSPGSLSGFGIGSIPSSMASRSNPFGASTTVTTANMSSSVSLSVPSGEVFRPASLTFQSLHHSQQSQPAFSSANPVQQPSSGSGFGQPARIGMGQQALGSVLGSFGQSRQLGGSLPGGGFGAIHPVGGFKSAATGGGFAGVAPTGVFQTAATGGGCQSGVTGGGFAGVAATGGFQSAATGGGFAGFGNVGSGFVGAGGAAIAPPATNTGGFAGAAGGAGGFGAFSKQGNSGFSLGSGAGSRQPPSGLFTQMRK